MLDEISFTNVNCSEYISNGDGFQKLASNLKKLKKITFEGECNFLSDRSIISLSSNSKDLEEIRIHTDSHDVTENAIGFVMRNSHKLTSLAFYSLIDSSYNSPFSIKNSIVYAKKLHTLCFLGYNDTLNKILCSIARANPPLKKLGISEYYKDMQTDTLSMLFQSLCSIEDLNLRYIYMDASIISPISQYLTKLTRINIHWCKTLDNHCFFLLLNSCPLLEEIKMHGVNVGSGDISRKKLHKYGRIRSLSLTSNVYLDDKTLKKIARVCPNLQFLDISNCSDRISGKGISKVLKSCRFLTHLEIGDLGVSSIFGKLSKCRSLNLKVLKAAYTKLSDETMGVIGRTCRGLEYLDVGHCKRVTKIGIMEVMRNCKKLEKINLTNLKNNVSIDDLNLMVETRPSLKKIFLHSSYSLKNINLKYGCKIIHEPYGPSHQW